MTNPSRVHGLVKFIPNMHKKAGTDQLVSRTKCTEKPYECSVASQYTKLGIKIFYIEDVFQEVHGHFLGTIDQLEYHFVLMYATKHTHCSKWDIFHVFHRQYGDLNPTKELFIVNLLEAIKKFASNIK